MKWRDPVDGLVFWEPPGGGIEIGESPHEAAIRELYEETGYTESVTGPGFLVDREYTFAGREFRHTEAFFMAEVASAAKAGSFTDEELSTFVESRFVAIDDIETLDAPLQPPNLGEVLAEMLERHPRRSGE
jgi:8-oxo-dGTP pyrophosphatase MutT (NUDIX family)